MNISKIFKAVFLQFSGILGAGIFALPYLFYYSNFAFATIVLIFIAVFMAILNFFYIDIITHTRENHQLSGYAQIYLGPKSKFLSVLNLLFLGFGGILAYLKLSSLFIPVIFPGISPLLSAVFFILLLGVFHFGKIRFFEFAFNILPVVSFAIIFILFFLSFGFPPANFDSVAPNFICFGGIIFALAGFTIIPEVGAVLNSAKNKKALLKDCSLAGLILAVIVYFLFAYAVIRISSNQLSVDSIAGVFKIYPMAGKILVVLGLTSIFKASLNLLLILKDVFFYDFKLNEKLSRIFSFLVPILTLLLLNISFVKIISVVGAVSVFLSALLICLIRLKLPHTKLTYFLVYTLLSILIFGLIAENF